ncbi:MAG TPA: ABC-F family ATP-binding cassette domain-containing protein [Longimicrobiales bacterium]|nr:ABC-F family ATP-binding cassette domain-containing protein [Longimicrobiales bacterium]
MNVLNVSGLRKAFGGRTIFDGVSFSVNEGEKVGFIGANGSGKSTLFRIVAGEEGADAGDIAIRRGVRVGYLAQEPTFTAGQQITDAVAEGRPELRQALAAYEDVTRRLSAPHGDHDTLVHRQADLAATLDRLGGWDWMHRVESMLTRLGVHDWDRTVDDLSGGEAKRVAMARALLAQPDLLLLDEPTNHLDADTVLFLEEYLMDYAGAVMLITHDRYFLDRVVDRMIEVSTGQLNSFDGGYTEYLEASAARTERQAVVDARRRKLIEQELDWARRSPPARTGKQRARIQRAKSLESESETYRAQRAREMRLQAPETTRLGRTVLNLHGVSKSYDDRTLIRNFSTIMRAGERIGIIGPNGAGKTTLLRIILGEEAADAGEVELGVNTRIAYYDQQRAELNPEVSVYEAAGNTDWVEIAGRRTHLRSYLEDFLFPTERQQQKVGSLSGGERNRLMLAKLLMQPANLLILDEPTNDLDLVTLQVLEAAIADYPGCVLMVTHDRFFLDKIATALFVFEGDGVVHRHEGNFELYRRLREQKEAAAAAEAAAGTTRASGPGSGAASARTGQGGGTQSGAASASGGPPSAAQADAPRKLTWKEARELEGLEDRIMAAEATRDELAARLADPDLYQDAAAAAETNAAYQAAVADVEALYARWTELEERRASGD